MISSFSGKNAFLSNFYPIEVTINGITYPTAEHAYVAQKSISISERINISEIKTPGEAKKYGRKMSLHPMWNKIRIPAMQAVLSAKFQDPEMLDRLLKTENQTLVEGNTWGDRFWGAVYEDGDWTGENNLGVLLMYLRQEAQANAIVNARKLRNNGNIMSNLFNG